MGRPEQLAEADPAGWAFGGSLLGPQVERRVPRVGPLRPGSLARGRWAAGLSNAMGLASSMGDPYACHSRSNRRFTILRTSGLPGPLRHGLDFAHIDR